MKQPPGDAGIPSRAPIRAPAGAYGSGLGARAAARAATLFACAAVVDIAVRQAWSATQGGAAMGPADVLLTALVALLVAIAHTLLSHPGSQRITASVTVGLCVFAFGVPVSGLLAQSTQVLGPATAALAASSVIGLAAALASAWFAAADHHLARFRSAPDTALPLRRNLLSAFAVASAVLALLPWAMALNGVERTQDERRLTTILTELRAQDDQLALLALRLATGAGSAPPLHEKLSRILQTEQRIARLARTHASTHAIDPRWQRDWVHGETTRAASAQFRNATRQLPLAAASVADRAQRAREVHAYRLAVQRTGNVTMQMRARAAADNATYRRWRTILLPVIGFLLCIGLAAPWLRLLGANLAHRRKQARVMARATNAMLLTDRDWCVTWVNPAFERLTGIDAYAALGQQPCALLRTEDPADDTASRIRDAFIARVGFRETLLAGRADRRTFWAEIDMQPMVDDDGQPDGFCMVIVDVSATKEAEAERQRSAAALAALAASESRFRRLADEANDIIVTTDLEGCITYVSEAATNLGWAAQDLLGANVHTLVHPEDLPGVLARRRQLADGTSLAALGQRVYRVRAADGRWVWMESSPNLVTAADGAPSGVTAYLRDISGRRHAELALQEHIDILDSIAEVSGVGGWSLNLETGGNRWTAQTRRIYGVRDDYDTRLAQDLDFYPEPARAQLLAAIEAARTAGTPWDMELPFTDATGRAIWVRSAGRAQWRDGKVVALFGSFADVTRERDARQRLIDASEDARTALAALSSYQAALDRHAIVSMTAADGTICFANDRFCEVTGFTRAELVGANHRLLKSDVHPPELFADLWATISRGCSWRGQLCNRAKDGSLHWLDTTILPVCNAEGLPERYVSIRYDLTEQKALEARNAQALRIREGISAVQSAFIEHGLGDAMRLALALALDAGESAYGFIGEVLQDDGVPYLRTHALSNIAWDDASRRIFAQQAAGGVEFRNPTTLFGSALVTGLPVIANAAATDARAGGVPPGHPPLNAFLGMPIHVHGELVALVGLANRPQGYDEQSISSLQPLFEAVGQMVRSARERCAREAAEAALQKERQRLRDVIQGTGVGIWTWDLGSDAVWFNERWTAILGYSSETLARWKAPDWFERYHPDDLEEADRRTRGTFEGDADDIDVEVRMCHANGHWVWIHLRGSVSSRNSAGRPTVLAGMAQDISERKHGERMRALIAKQLGAAKEQAVRRGQEEAVLAELLRLALADTDIPTFLTAALESTLQSIDWLRDVPIARITLVPHPEPGGAATGGAADSTMQAAPLSLVYQAPFHVQPSDPALHAVALVDSNRVLGTLEIALHAVAATPLAATEQALPREEQAFLERAAATLVTGIRHRDAASRLREAAVAAQSASIAKSQFLATMSHEIRTPMNGVLGTLDLLLGTALDADQQTWARTAHDAAQQLLQLLNEILDFSRLEANQVRLEQLPTATEALLQRVLALHRVQAQEKGVRIELRVDANTPAWVLGDPMRLQQVLINLVGNAVKFTDHGEVAIRVRHDGAQLQVDVQDTGIGIAEDARRTLFNRFVQADSSITRRFGGTGLGLAICGQLINAMGGEIGVASRLGEGSLFWFSVPAPPCPAPEAPGNEDATGPNAQRPEHDGTPLRVLVAEDNPVNQRILRAFLEGVGHDVTLVGDGAQAVHAHRHAPFDIVLMDVQMPVMDGLSATTALRALPGDAATVPIIAITANAMPGDREHYLAAGMDGYVSKPINRRNLNDSIAAAMQAHRGRASRA